MLLALLPLVGQLLAAPVRASAPGGERKWAQPDPAAPRQQEALEDRRREQLTDQWQQRYNIRAGVEGTISQAVRRTRIRRTRYTGLPKTHLGHVLAATPSISSDSTPG